MTPVPLRIVICDGTSHAAELCAFIEHDPAFEVRAVLTSPDALLSSVDRLDPQLVVLDLGPHGTGALAAVGTIMGRRPRPILVISDDTACGRAAQALAAGALEVVARSALRLPEPDDLWATALRSRIKRLATVQMQRKPRGGRVSATPPRRRRPDRAVRVIGIGASTGGPPALRRVLGALPAEYPLPILVVQHIADGFAAGLVDWLDAEVAIPVGFAAAGEPLRPGAWFAPQGCHLGVDRAMRVALDHTTVHGPHRPSVDMLFESLAATVGDAAVAVVLTGMGRDGAEGADAVRAAGGFLITQDEQSSVVFGMPRAAAEAGADQVLALPAIGPALRGLPTARMATA